MNIDKRLNLVIPHEQADGSKIYIHSTPISNEAFKQNFELMALLWSDIAANYGASSAPRIAAMLLRKIADDRRVLPMVEAGLMAEINRLTMVVGGPQPLMLTDAVKAGVISAEDLDTVENMLVFFTAVSCMVSGKRRLAWIDTMASMWDAQTSSLNSTDFARSLPTSIGTDNTGKPPTT